MASQALCAWCGKVVVVADGESIPTAAGVVCQPCADWHKARGLDQEDRIDVEGLGAIRPIPGQRDHSRQT